MAIQAYGFDPALGLEHGAVFVYHRARIKR